MIAVDAGVVISFLVGETTAETRLFADLLSKAEAVLPPSIVTELLSSPGAGSRTAELIDGLETVALGTDYWAKAGRLRALVRQAGRKAALGDALAAQACLDADLAFLTADHDFQAFAELAGLRLVEAR